MIETDRGQNFATYWKIWGTLLLLTMVMLFLDQAPIPRLLFVVVMVGAMLTKASLIGGYFMHLRHESPFFTYLMVIGLLFFGVLLYALIARDAVRIFAMSH